MITKSILHRLCKINATIFTIIVGLLSSCGKSSPAPTKVYLDDRNNIEYRELISIEDSLPLLHAFVKMTILGDTLIINDSQSRNHQFYAYNVVTGRYLGAFGKYGVGPGEIANFGLIGIATDSGTLYGVDYNQWKVYGFDIAKALSDSTYQPFKKVDFYKGDGTRPIIRSIYLNDSTVYCAVLVPSHDYRKIGYHLGRFNLLTGRSELLDSINPDEHSGILCKHPDKDELIEFSIEFDRIRFFDFNGNLKRMVYGPDYKDYQKKASYYESTPTIVGDNIYIVYANGGDFRDPDVGHQIIVMDLEGNYIKSIDVGIRINAITYHPETRRMYVATWDEPQFGYFEIDD